MSDALDKLGLAGVASGITRQSTTRRIAGPVLTVRLGIGDPGSGAPRHLCTAAIDAAQEGAVIVVEHHSGIDAGGWGGILSLGARLRGVGGAIVDGPVRDIDECAAIDFPVFARSVTPRTARGRIVELSFNEPVTIGGVSVAAGDFAIADGSGVAFIRASDIERVIEAAGRIAAREAEMTRALQNGARLCEVMGATYEQLLRK